ncbi:YlaI family protein [Peribacillus tepidiphilus]|uniref:YlaI family protein n=1 Tax=Peribacillus tepidiphilus TaxID=2652445 RepID=UPI0012919EEB|nr:YlaI family protein [Peribacillus tepidiphilus]
MRVKCVLCDKIEKIESDSFLAKRLRNRPIHTYMCQPCHERIEQRTKERLSSGKFRFYKPICKEEDW